MIDVASCAFFRNFSNPLRVKIINELMKKEMCVNEISEALKVEQSKVSHALSLLKKHDIVFSTCNGKKRIYRINKRVISPILKFSRMRTNKTVAKERECL